MASRVICWTFYGGWTHGSESYNSSISVSLFTWMLRYNEANGC